NYGNFCQKNKCIFYTSNFPDLLFPGDLGRLQKGKCLGFPVRGQAHKLTFKLFMAGQWIVVVREQWSTGEGIPMGGSQEADPAKDLRSPDPGQGVVEAI